MTRVAPDPFLSLRSACQTLLLRLRPWSTRSNLIWVIGVFVVSVVVLVTYYSALQVGYWFDDYNLLKIVGRPEWVEFLASSFDPRAQPLWYRPIQQVQWRIEYVLLGGDAFGYHVIQNLFHLTNCVILFGLVGRISRNRRVGFLAALIYAVLPAYSLSVFWVSVADPLASSFYLLAVWLWVDYLEKGGWARFALTFISFVFSLLTKETGLTLPITLLLVDRWLVAKPTRLQHWMRRIAPFFLLLVLWALLVRNVIMTKLPVGYSSAVLSRWLSNMVYGVSALVFPWSIDLPVRYVALLAFLCFFIYGLVARKLWLLFLCAVGLFSVAPMANLPSVAARYFYLPTMVSAVGAGVIVEGMWRFIRTRASATRLDRLGWSTLALVVLVVTLMDSAAIGEAAEGFSTLARQARLQFRPVFQQHATFEPGTFLYFIEPPFSTYNISGFMFLRYGANVSVGGNDYEVQAGLRNYNTSYVFYTDDQNTMREQRVDPAAVVSISPALPMQFGPAVSLEGFEAVKTNAKPGEAIILILYWRTLGKMDKDYTVFAHLLNDNGALVASYDSQPRRGTMPTSVWQPGHMIVDAVMVPIDSSVPSGQGYRIEVGLYYLPTMERLPITQAGNRTGDTVVFKSFSVEP